VLDIMGGRVQTFDEPGVSVHQPPRLTRRRRSGSSPGTPAALRRVVVKPLVVVLLGVIATGCMPGPTVFGHWIPRSEAGPTEPADCDDSGLPQDTVQITASDATGFGSSTTVDCSDAAFAMDVPEGARAFQITFLVLDDGGAPSPNTVTLAGPIENDIDLGHVQLEGSAG